MARKSSSIVLVAVLLGAVATTFAVAFWLLNRTVKAVETTRLFQMPSASMEPTLKSGSIHLIDFAAYRTSSPKVDDIVIYHPPEFLNNGNMAKLFFLHRCVGAPGDIVEIRAGVLFRNGKRISEPFVKSNKELNFKLASLEGKLIPLIYDEKRANNDNCTDAEFWLDDSANVGKLIQQVPKPIPAGTILVMGDNRAGAYDSRAWGTLPLSRVVGKLIRL